MSGDSSLDRARGAIHGIDQLPCGGALRRVDSKGLAFLSSCSLSRGLFRVLRFSPHQGLQNWSVNVFGLDGRNHSVQALSRMPSATSPGRLVAGGALERSGGAGMTRNSLVASFGLFAGLAAALSAQTPSSNG